MNFIPYTEIAEYKKPEKYNPNPFLRIEIEDPLPGQQTTGNLFDVSVTLFNTLKGVEIFAYQRGRDLRGHIEPGSKEPIIFDNNHTVVRISRK